MNNELRNNLLKRYVTPGDKIAFSSRRAIAKELKSTQDQANKDILSYNDAYTLHREYKKPRTYNPYFSYLPRDQVQCDLIDMHLLSDKNDSYNFILVCTDIFSRKAWVRPLKSKTGLETATNLRDILLEMEPFLPKSILFDHGKEFLNQHVKKLLEERNIKVILPGSQIKAAYAEVFNKSFQKLIYRDMTHRQSYRYIDYLQDILKTYNNTEHTSLGFIFSPNEAEIPENIQKVRQIQITNRSNLIIKGGRMKAKFKVGDKVRIQKEKGVFDRGYKETSNPEYFEIVNINHRLPIITYTIRSLDRNDIIIGGYYAEELQLVQGDVYKIEKVIKSRKVKGKEKEFLIKWLHFGPQHNSWIKQSDMYNI